MPSETYRSRLYQDIVKAQISKAGKIFTFTMDVAAPVPAIPVGCRNAIAGF